MTIILNGTTGITTPGITNQGVVEFTAGSVSAPSITTTGDTNTGIYFPAADTIAFTEGGVESMRIDSNANVGINTTSPSAKLDVVAASFNGGPLIGARFNTANFRMGFGIANSNGFPFLGLNVNNAANDNGTFDISSWASRLRMDNGIFQFQTSSASGTAGNAVTWSTHAYLDTSGNLGLGVTPSAWGTYKGFQVGGSAALWGPASTGSEAYLNANSFYNGSNRIYISTNFATEYSQVSGAHNWKTAPSGTAGNAITFTDAMKLSSIGQLEVFATSGNGGRIDVFSNAQTSNQITLAQGFALATDNIGYLYNRANTAFVFGTNNTERARITAAGELLLGTTTAYAKLAVATAANQPGIYVATAATGQDSFSFNCSATTSVYGIGLYSAATAANTVALFRGYHTTSTQCFNIAGSGNVTNTNNSYGAISDAKLKENIVDATPKLEKLKQVRVVNYNLIGDEQKQIGVIAQELEAVFPSMVEETIDYDPKGNDLGTTTKSVKYSVFVPMLIKAIQELSAKVTALESK